MQLSDYTKAGVGGILAFLSAMSVALINNGDINGTEWGVIIGAFVAGTGIVAAVPNTGTYAWVDTSNRNAAIARKVAEAKSQDRL